MTLQDVCYKPFASGACATQSLLQYWQMDRRIYEKGDPATRARLSPDYCLSHWSTACRGAYGGPQVCFCVRPRCRCAWVSLQVQFAIYQTRIKQIVVLSISQ